MIEICTRRSGRVGGSTLSQIGDISEGFVERGRIPEGSLEDGGGVGQMDMEGRVTSARSL